MMAREQLVPKAMRVLHVLIERYAAERLQPMLREVVGSEQFLRAPGSQKQHHAWAGGLAVHTAEVTYLAAQMGRHMEADLNVVVAAATLHDIMKMRDYEVDEETGVIRKTEYASRIRHVAGSYAWFMQTVDPRISEGMRDAIGHAMLAHHGRQEWGSPVEPQTREAACLHYADMLSAHFSGGEGDVLRGILL